MKRRDFFKLLAGLPFLGFLKGKTEEQQDIEESLKSLKEPGAIPLETFRWSLTSGTTSTANTYVVIPSPWDADEPDLYTLDDGEPI